MALTNMLSGWISNASSGMPFNLYYNDMNSLSCILGCNEQRQMHNFLQPMWHWFDKIDAVTQSSFTVANYFSSSILPYISKTQAWKSKQPTVLRQKWWERKQFCQVSQKGGWFNSRWVTSVAVCLPMLPPTFWDYTSCVVNKAYVTMHEYCPECKYYLNICSENSTTNVIIIYSLNSCFAGTFE